MYRTVARALLAILVVAGCGATDNTARPGPRSGSGAGTGTSTSARPTRPQPAPPTAADGTNVAACFHGTCQIAVSGPVRIPLDGRSGLTELAVVDVDSDQLHFRTATAGGGSGTADLGPGCVLTFHPGGGGSACGGGYPPPFGHGLAVRVLDITDGTAVLDLSLV